MGRAERDRADGQHAQRNAARGGIRPMLDLNRPWYAEAAGPDLVPLQKRCAVGAAEVAAVLKTLGKVTPVNAYEQVALGIVLEPTLEMGCADLQGDVYSRAEVLAAKQRTDVEGLSIGLQHRDDITSKVVILDSFILPTDAIVNGQQVVAGTWLMSLKINDPEIWAACLSGALSGLSIGGTANRVPLK